MTLAALLVHRSWAPSEPRPESSAAAKEQGSGHASSVWLRTALHAGLHWGPGLGLPSVAVHASDTHASARSKQGGAAVAALRALLMHSGALLAEGARALDADEVRALRAAYAEDVALGARRFEDAGLVWRTDRVKRLGVRECRGDALREPAHLFELRVDAAQAAALAQASETFEGEASVAREFEIESVLADWAQGNAVLADFVPTLLQRALAGGLDHVSLDLEEPHEVVPGIRMLPVRSPTLPPATHTNVFLVGGREAVLVEPASPFPDELNRILDWLEEAEAHGVELKAICATHHHPDHIGGARALSERLGVGLWAHAKTIEALEGKVEFERELRHDEVISLAGGDHGPDIELRCVHTPGHAWGHLCFFESRSRALISGDMVAGVGSILVEKQDGDMRLYLESLAQMKALDPSCLLPAHGGIIADPAACLDHYVAHRLAREEKVAQALQAAGEGSPVSLVPAAYQDTPKMLWPLAARALEAHLIHLCALGRARDLGDGRYRYIDSRP